MDRAGAAAAARAMHVEEHDAIALAERRAVDAVQRPAHRRRATPAETWPGNDRIRHAGEPAVPEMHVGAADLRPRGPQQRAARRADRARELADLDRLPRRGHDRGEDAVAHAVYVILERMLIQTAVRAVAGRGARRAGAARSTQTYQAHRRRGGISSASLRLAVHAAATRSPTIRSRICSASRWPRCTSKPFQYRTARRADARRTCSEYGSARRGIGATVYPFGIERAGRRSRCAAASSGCRPSA